MDKERGIKGYCEGFGEVKGVHIMALALRRWSC